MGRVSVRGGGDGRFQPTNCRLGDTCTCAASAGVANHLRMDLVLDAFELAIRQRKPQGVIHHSDPGTQYTSIAFGKCCHQAGVRPSTGTVGDAYDNALCESFFVALACELLDRHSFRSRGEAERAVFEFIEPTSSSFIDRLCIASRVRECVCSCREMN